MADVRFDWAGYRMYFVEFFIVTTPSVLIYAYGLVYRVLPFVLHRQFGQFGGRLLLLILLTWFVYDGLQMILYCIVIPVWNNQSVALTIQKNSTWPFFYAAFWGGKFFAINMEAGFLVGARLFSQWLRKEAESQRLNREKLSHELALLKLQLNPALLFESLDTLHGQICNEPQQAPATVLNLAHYLSYVLYDGQAETVPLADEISTIEQYVFLQRLTHTTKLDVAFSFRGDIDSRLTRPMLLLRLVEQAVETAQPARPGEPAWVSVDLAVNDTQLTLKLVQGQADSFTVRSNQLADIEKQLYFQYGNTYRLQIVPEPDVLITILTLPISNQLTG